MNTQNKVMTWTGWILAGLIGALLVFSATMKFWPPAEVVEEMKKFDFRGDNPMLAIGIVELACVAIYLFPRTAILGAVLLTGYLGGAIVTHVRIEEDFIPPVIVGILVWLAVFLREPRLRVLLPWRWPMK
jgi:hypothetical protein